MGYVSALCDDVVCEMLVRTSLHKCIEKREIRADCVGLTHTQPKSCAERKRMVLCVTVSHTRTPNPTNAHIMHVKLIPIIHASKQI